MQKELVVLLRVLSSSYLLFYVMACSKPTYSNKEVAHTIMLGDSAQLPLTYTLKELGDFNGPSIRLDSSYNYLNKRYLHFIDGKMVENQNKDKAFKKLKKKEIDSVEIIRAEEAVELYGQKAKYGAVIIRTKQ